METLEQVEKLKYENLPNIISILPITDIALFPKMIVPIIVYQNEQMKMIDDSMMHGRIIGLLITRSSQLKNEYTKNDLYSVGTTAFIQKLEKINDNKIQMVIQGMGRFKVKKFINERLYLKADIENIKEVEKTDKEIQALRSIILNNYQKVLKLTPAIPPEIFNMANAIQEAGILSDMVTSTINSTKEEKQKILETFDVKKRITIVNKILNKQLEILELGSKLQTEVEGSMDKQKKEYYLRQQLDAIKKELGEQGRENAEAEKYRARLAEKEFPEAVLKEANRELERFSKMTPSSSEYMVASTYLDWLTVLPWNESTKDNLDISTARKVLDKDHFGLEKPKKRIIEYLAIRKLKPDSKGPILCFAGPPGTGKTSVAQSIARSLGRKYVRISLGGIRDEAEIKGHRRTYVGALPGRIIQGIRRSGTKKPVFILDEIDKMSSDFRGDPSSALLEVLDPEQNNSFVDHYLDLPFDLSESMFITTANVLDTIPPALRDRMEVIEMLGYTREEKVKVAKRCLIPKQREENGLKAKQIMITEGAIKKVIQEYTREAGLRNLERELGSIIRSAAALIAENKAKAITVNQNQVSKYLGPEKINSEIDSVISAPGVALGLAWTQTGGEMLFIEALSMKGRKGLTLTGQLGDVMKESAMAAMNFIRSHAKELKIAEDYFDKHDIHIHVPAGAIPKDGPSAGVTMLSALVSLLTGKKIKKKLAMTGEITLRGQVLPVGGIKEKVLAAHRAGVKTLILPEWNKKDLEDIPLKVRKTIKFHFVDKMRELLKLALEK